ARDRTIVWSLSVREVEQDFVDITPAPTLGRIIAFDDRMFRGVKMFGGVFVGRVIATTDMAAAAADPQMQPFAADLQAFLATEPERTSPTANTPGTEVSNDDAARPRWRSDCAPVTTKPPRSSVTPQPSSQPVAGSAPTNRNKLRISAVLCSPDRRLFQRTRSSEESCPPSSATTSVLNISSMFGVASMRSIR